MPKIPAGIRIRGAAVERVNCGSRCLALGLLFATDNGGEEKWVSAAHVQSERGQPSSAPPPAGMAGSGGAVTTTAANVTSGEERAAPSGGPADGNGAAAPVRHRPPPVATLAQHR